MDIDSDVNLLPNYCPHDEKTFLSAIWANQITHVGQSFEGGAHKFRIVLCKYVVECGFEFKYLKNDSVRITTGRTWLVHARVLDVNGFFYLRKWNNEHICGVVVCTVNNRRLKSDLVSDIFAHSICNKPLTRLIDVSKKPEASYLRPTVHFSINSGNYINIDCDEYDKWFKRFFISFKACIDGFKHCRPLLFLDGTFLKGRLFPITFAIVSAENATNWSWFLQHLHNALVMTGRLHSYQISMLASWRQCPLYSRMLTMRFACNTFRGT
ncbi:hypothetical protein ACSBR2_018567 [Camellia fascicularis]